jgi:hypothetical protein
LDQEGEIINIASLEEDISITKEIINQNSREKSRVIQISSSKVIRMVRANQIQIVVAVTKVKIKTTDKSIIGILAKMNRNLVIMTIK